MPNVLRSIRNMTGRYYKPIWEDSDRQAAFELCNRIRKHNKVPEYSKSKFDEGWQYRTIFHENYKAAKDEFVNLVFGWW
jgi:hypothetical protein